MPDELKVTSPWKEMTDLIVAGWTLSFWMNELGSYTAVARHKEHEEVITDDFTLHGAVMELMSKVRDFII